MKRLHLFFSSFSQNLFSSLMLVVITSVALISVQNVVGQYRYINHSKYIIDNEYLKNSDYFMVDISSLPLEYDKQLEYSNNIRENISAFDGVESIAYTQNGTAVYRSTNINLSMYNESMRKAFQKQLSEGEWFQSQTETDDIPNVVICGAIFDDISINSNITIKLYGNNHEITEQTVHVIGKIAYPYLSADYNTISEDICRLITILFRKMFLHKIFLCRLTLLFLTTTNKLGICLINILYYPLFLSRILYYTKLTVHPRKKKKCGIIWTVQALMQNMIKFCIIPKKRSKKIL